MKKIIFIFILIIAFFFRAYGLNWDQSHHLHPDERFMTMVSSAVSMPKSIGNYFDQKNSTLNPYNFNFSFYVYGTFPLLITRFFGEITGNTGYDQIFLVGRILSAFADVGTTVLIYHLAFIIFKKREISLLSSFFYAIAVFPIQQAHFFTVDSFTVFFSTFTLFLFTSFLINRKKYLVPLAGFSFGLTLANKISIIITLPLFLIFIFLIDFNFKNKKLFKKIVIPNCFKIAVFLISGFFAFRLFQPYAFDGIAMLSKHFQQNISEAHKMITGEIDYPPNIQWAYTKPLIHPLLNIFSWGLGPVISILTLMGSVIAIKMFKKEKLSSFIFLFFFSVIVFVYQGIQLAKYMRYFYPLYPLFAILAGMALFQKNIAVKNKLVAKTILIFILLVSPVWTIAFISVYGSPHSRIKASAWIYNNIPPGAKLTSEEWDDGLPLDLANYSNYYKNISMGIYNSESLEKWQKITAQLSEADYIIMSSSRLFGSIPRIAQRYPIASLYYQLLFSEKLGFKKVTEITSYPCFLSLCINDSSAEESFTVYDHPKIVVFKKDKDFSIKLLYPLLDQNLINQTKYINPKDTNKLFF